MIVNKSRALVFALAIAGVVSGCPCQGLALTARLYSEGECVDTVVASGEDSAHANRSVAVSVEDDADLWAQFADEYLDGEESAEDIVGDEEDFLEMHRNPVNLNAATKADLLKMPFLSEAQADSIYNKVRRLRGMLSMGELAFVRNLGQRERAYMLLFFYCGAYVPNLSPADRKIARKKAIARIRRQDPQRGLRTDVSLVVGAPIEKREGFHSHTKSQIEANPNIQYLGNRMRVALRYRGSWDNNALRWGLTSAKSEGEPMMEKQNWFLDSYSLFLTGRSYGRHTIVKRWAVGDYRMQMGLGLVVGATSPDANSVSLTYRPRQQGLTPHTSTSEALFLRGGAIEMGMGRWTARAFVSYRDIDATLKNDSITTIITNGYHRTRLEMSKRHDVACGQGGAQVGCRMGSLALALQGAYTHYNKPFIHPTALYRRHYYHGSTFWNYGLYYSCRINAFTMQGEAAVSNSGAVAVQDRWQYAPDYRCKLNLVHRYYSGRYLSPLGQTFRAASMIQNEHGILLSAVWRPREMWLVRLWADYAHHANPLYRCSHSSNRISACAQVAYTPYRHTEYYIRYKYRQRGQDDSLKQTDTRTQHYLKAQARYAVGAVGMTSAADLTFLREPNKAWHKGWMLSHRIACVLPLSGERDGSAYKYSDDGYSLSSATGSAYGSKARTLQINAAAALFRTDAYAEALRFYEPGLLYAFSLPSCYYHGVRASLAPVLTLGPLSIAAKYSITHYTNRSSVGTGLRLYRGSTLQDVTLQLRLRL